MTQDLFFDYKSTSAIRIKIENCLENDLYPMVYRIKTKCLDFIIPKKAVRLSSTHVYIPLSIYRNVLTKYYIDESKLKMI